MSVVNKTSLVRKTIRYELTNEASSLVGHGTPLPMAPAEDKIRAQKGIYGIELIQWGSPYIIDVTIDSEYAADHGWTVEQVEDNVRNILSDHYADFERLKKFTELNGRYPHDQRLVFSHEDFVVLQNKADQSFTVCCEKEGENAFLKLKRTMFWRRCCRRSSTRQLRTRFSFHGTTGQLKNAWIV